MFAVTFLHGMVFYGPIATLYRYEYGITIFDITVIEGISLAVTLCLEIPLGILADKVGYKRTMVFTCALFLVSKIVFWQADSYALFLVERILIAIVFAGLSGLDTTILYLSDKKENSHRNFGVYNTLGSLGLVVAALVYSAVVGSNYRLSALLTVVSHALALILTFFLTDIRHKKRSRLDWQEIKGIFKSIFNDKKLLLFLLAISLFNQTHQILTVFVSQLKYEETGMPLFAIGGAFILLSILGSFGFLSGFICKRIGNRLAAILFYLVAIIGCATIAATTSAMTSMLCIGILRLAYSVFEPLQLQKQNEFVHSENRASELSIYSAIMSVIGIGANLIFGMFAQLNTNLSFILGAAACLIGLVIYAPVMLRSERKAI